MSGFRLPGYGLIDRSKTLSFQFDGNHFQGHPGDTVASALLANGVRVVGRSFKYHRPRGVWGAWFDDPNAIFDISLNGTEIPNCAGATTCLRDGMRLRSVNTFPSAQFDVKAILNWFSPFLPAGFYYKTFIWPNWHWFEPTIRKMAGLGRLNEEIIENYQSDQIHQSCDLLVVGGGACGLTAARTAAQSGRSVLLVEDHRIAGGGLYRRGRKVENEEPGAWVEQHIDAIKTAGGQVLLATTAFGVYDHNLVALAEDRGFSNAPRLWKIRAKRILVATGAIDRSLTFVNNDLPGIMSVEGALEFLGRYGVLAGREIALLSNNNRAEPSADLLREAGANVRILDASQDLPAAIGGKTIRGVKIATQSVACDTLLASGGLTPVVHLWCQAGGKLDWNEKTSAFLPARPPDNMAVAGAANGTFDLEEAIAEARTIALGSPPPRANSNFQVANLPPGKHSPGRQWIDFQHDVTLKDVELAVRENYISVEHLKRYTTLGMACDQGKTSNMAGLAALAAIRNRSVPKIGTTTFRPPFVPVPLELYRGARRQQLLHPLKRLILESEHRAAGAAMGEYGGWLRPAWYGTGNSHEAIRREVLAARNNAAIMDTSPLGKIEILGPDAEKFVNFVFYNTISTLKPGHIRYGFMLTERGIIFDDGVVTRIDGNRFIISCSSSHVDSVNRALEGWRQDGHDPDSVYIHDTTQNWATITVSGPEAREILTKLDLGVDLSAEAFPHMNFRHGNFASNPARISRVSFTGDLSYEVSVPLSSTAMLWSALTEAGKPVEATLIGVEALSILRAEKGYIIVGKDTDGETMPHDLGFGIPRMKKKVAFVGDRALHTQAANAENKRQLVGLLVANDNEILPTGAHLIETSATGHRSIGYVTSSYHSPTLGHPIALALLENGKTLTGKTLPVWNQGETRQAKVVSPCFYDADGGRINA